MGYRRQTAPGNLDTDGVRKYTEEQLLQIQRAAAVVDETVAGIETRVTALEAAPPVFRVYLNGAYSTTFAAFNVIQFNNVSFDSDSWWNSTTKRYVPQKAGYYRFSGRVYTSSSGGSITLTIFEFWKNGTRYSRAGQAFTTESLCSGTDLIPLNGTTDYVEARMYCEGTGTPVVGVAGFTALVSLEAEWIRSL